jgi:hypothetical protein
MARSRPVYRIHPSIGVARVGDSDDYYLAPESVGGLPVNPSGRPFLPEDFRDADGRLRRQGARFEIYRYENGDVGVPVRPGADGVERIEWTVHLANKKAAWYQFIVSAGSRGYAPDHPLRNAAATSDEERTALIIDPGPRTVRGPNQRIELSRAENPGGYPMTFPPDGLEPAQIDSLGGLRSDAESRLIVLGGYGNSGCIPGPDGRPAPLEDYANNDGWFDDTADGPVRARLVLTDGRTVEVDHPAWVAVAPPRYAPELINIVTLYDTMYDAAVRGMQARPDIFSAGRWQPDFRPSFADDILPIIERIQRYAWVSAIPPHAHDLDIAKLGDPDPRWRALREFYLSVLRPPDAPNLESSPDHGMPLMPLLCGDNCFAPGPPLSSFLTLTQTQFFYMQQWAGGIFDPAPRPPLAPADALDRAALEQCVGGAFSPGIEVTWISRDTRIYAEPLRIRAKRHVRPPLSLGQDFADGLEPGDLCKYMALPWQADFNECSQEEAGSRFAYWWPVQRPDYVFTERGDELAQVAWVGTDADQTAPDYLKFADLREMVDSWAELGFVVNVGSEQQPRFVEVARRSQRSVP